MGTVQINAGLAIDRNSSNLGTTAVGFRRAIAAFVQHLTPGNPAPGRFSDDHFVVTGKANMSYDVSGGAVILTRASQGAYIVPSHQTVNVTTDPTGGINPRIDRIYVHQPDPALDGAGVAVGAIIGVAVGAAAASPSLPSIPSGALELARVQVPASATATAGLTFTNVAPVTGISIGSKVTVRTKAGITSGSTVPSNADGEDGDIYYQRLT